jgi:hypothetical protein
MRLIIPCHCHGIALALRAHGPPARRTFPLCRSKLFALASSLPRQRQRPSSNTGSGAHNPWPGQTLGAPRHRLVERSLLAARAPRGCWRRAFAQLVSAPAPAHRSLSRRLAHAPRVTRPLHNRGTTVASALRLEHSAQNARYPSKNMGDTRWIRDPTIDFHRVRTTHFGMIVLSVLHAPAGSALPVPRRAPGTIYHCSWWQP